MRGDSPEHHGHVQLRVTRERVQPLRRVDQRQVLDLTVDSLKVVLWHVTEGGTGVEESDCLVVVLCGEPSVVRRVRTGEGLIGFGEKMKE